MLSKLHKSCSTTLVKTLIGGVRGLAIGLGKQYREMAETVARNAELAGSSLMNESEQATSSRIESEIEVLKGLMQLLGFNNE